MKDDRLISLNAAIYAFKKKLTVGESKGNYVTIRSAIGYEGAKQILEALPSAQKKGHWIDEKTSYSCSECHRGCWVNSNYCPWCGADMRGESDG